MAGTQMNNLTWYERFADRYCRSLNENEGRAPRKAEKMAKLTYQKGREFEGTWQLDSYIAGVEAAIKDAYKCLYGEEFDPIKSPRCNDFRKSVRHILEKRGLEWEKPAPRLPHVEPVPGMLIRWNLGPGLAIVANSRTLDDNGCFRARYLRDPKKTQIIGRSGDIEVLSPRTLEPVAIIPEIP